ncbi:MAG: penicillin-binding protein 2 [Betaproteobacteria bacterium]|nr:penicillin-binding protein 2 [Betaproteobacteria bacterium]MDH5221580.1 penicillin-binding protein 2 [Betaproteobacteria bacterium]MDH5350438.1 penicillin-binding protein 2 [Betaproteobacteria bacterium]
MSAAAPALVRLPVWRARFVLAGFFAAFAVIAGRSLYLQAMHTDFLQEKGEARYSRVLTVPATRGRILDRNGEALAVSTPVQSVWAIPGDVSASPAQLRRLASLLGADAGELRRKLGDASRDFVYLKRQIAPETAERVAQLGLEGIYQHPEYRRYYPGGEVTAHVVGFTGVDEAGQEGMELAFEASLGGVPGSRRVIKDRRGRVVEDIESIRAAQDGRDLTLSIDGKIQSLAYAALKEAVLAHRATAGALVALDVQTGEVLALANVPSFNPNNRARLSGAQIRNRALTDVFEPGSTLKPFTVALALESDRLSPATRVQIGNGGLRVAQHVIHDPHPESVLTVAQVIQKSSNVGAARIALALGREDMWRLFQRAGFGAPPQLGFPGEAAGRLRPAATWRPIEQATMAYGHGISVSLMQLARAYTMFARDGELVPVTLQKSPLPAPGTRVLSAQTAREMRAMLELAVQPGGTAPRARIMGWRVAGKTGTAHKQENGGYAADRYIASFVGLAPVSAPRIVVAVMIDEPAGGQYYGGVVAAPVFAQVARGALRALGVPYDAPLEPLPLPGAHEEAREST